MTGIPDRPDPVSRVSVVVPTFQNAPFVEATVESILAQTYPDYEIFIGDHGSTDGTWERLQRYAEDPRVTLWRTPAGGGAQANWQAVTAAARGEFIKLVCGDDLLYPTALSEQVAAMDTHPGVSLVSARRDLIDATGRRLAGGFGPNRVRGRHEGGAAIRRTVRAGTNIFGEPAAVLLRRADLVAVGGWWGDYPYAIDIATYTLVLLRGGLVAIPHSLAAFRVSDSQWSVALADDQAAQVIAFQQALADREPGLLSGFDLRRGALAARMLARGRRLAYRLLRRRMGQRS